VSDGNYHCYINDLACRRAPAVAEAEGLIASECYDEAEKAVIAADSSIYGAVEIAKMYRRRLEHLLAKGIEGVRIGSTPRPCSTVLRAGHAVRSRSRTPLLKPSSIATRPIMPSPNSCAF
jgi:hypothetical protein